MLLFGKNANKTNNILLAVCVDNFLIAAKLKRKIIKEEAGTSRL
jgi:hypothetical protein